ncbi:radical SAM protein [Kosmotoga pacifica]|uniref:Radical SAM core domain-containing protein n=1 Tax=Kosmotoga pacifica TaxID=1330330 RepID=A0A0G2Z863_9BACT|nr:radical SAM protein [Kosmotoga pacifica]AKI97805.1 hypothetical protein IX53_08280 [Kosmotoga pacifica]
MKKGNGIIAATKILKSVNPGLAKVFVPWLLKNPSYLKESFKLVKAFKKAEFLRKENLKKGILVPPVLILSITSTCNFRCSGCFATEVGTLGDVSGSLNKADWESIIEQARELGVFCFLIAGGEPFMFPELLSLNEKYSDSFFVIFSNGSLINDDKLSTLKHSKNTAVIISIEGGKELTDRRRGKGSFDRALLSLNNLSKQGILNGISVTITRENYKYWMGEENIDWFIQNGVRTAFLTEYIPVETSEDAPLYKQPLLNSERKAFREKVLYYKKSKNIFIIHSPGDEEAFGGCVSAGKGFAHVTPYGDLTPCPVSDIAMHNLKRDSLAEGLASTLFKEIRDSEGILENTEGPCALFSHQEELEALRKKLGAYKTGKTLL